MARVPDEFQEEFEGKGDTFLGIAELLYLNPDRQFTQDELAERFDCSNSNISKHTQEMEEWLDRRDGQTTYAWNTDVHDPGATEGLTATKRLYVDLWHLLKKHTRTTPGIFAVLGFAMFLAGAVVFAFFVGFSLSITQDSSIPTIIYLVIAAGSFFTGIVVTLISPFQAVVNRWLWARIPADLLQRSE